MATRGRKPKSAAGAVKEEIKEAVENVKAVVEEVKAEAEKETEGKTEAAEEVKKEPAKRGRKPAAEKKTEETKEPAKRGRKPAAEKKEAEVTEAVKKEAVANIVLQFDFGEYVSDEIVEKCKEAYKAENKAEIKTIDIYVKPADKKAYYVVNDKSAGSVRL